MDVSLQARKNAGGDLELERRTVTAGVSDANVNIVARNSAYFGS